MQQREEARLANAKIEGLEPKPLLEMEKEANDRYLRKTFGQISFSSRRSRCVSAANSQSSIRTQGEVQDTCSSTSKAPRDSTQETECTHVPSQEEEEELGFASRFMFDTLRSSGKSAVSRTGFLIDGSGCHDEGEGDEDEEAFESPRSTADGSLYMLGDAWAEEEVRHFGQVISAPVGSTKSWPASKPSTRPASGAATPRAPLEPPSPASAPVLPNLSAAAAPATPKANSVAGMLDRIKQQISAWDGRRQPKKGGGTTSTASTSRATSRASSVSGRQETVPQRIQPAPAPSGSGLAASARTAASQLMQPHPPSMDPPTTPTRPSAEERGMAGSSCNSSRSFRTFSQPSSRACSRAFGHAPCTRRSMDSAEITPLQLFAQSSRLGQDRSSLPMRHITPDPGGTLSPRAVLRGSLDHHQPQHHHSEGIPSLCGRRSLDTGESIRPASSLLALQRDPRVRSRSSCMTPAEVTRGLSHSQPLKVPTGTPHTEFAGHPGTPTRGTFYHPGIDRSSTSSGLASALKASPAQGTFYHPSTDRIGTSDSLAGTPKTSPKAATVAAATMCGASEPLASVGGPGQVGAQPQPLHQQPARRRKSVSIMLHRKSKSSVTDAIPDVLPL
ncbi:hypothetical protein DUNSADRAFT_11769 [Dunaliella salina]|uniref:Uncharacterized protein n=1 Tax=Dunaliella salina TaxID=3046 RepID=A0ABQ7GCN3_DUNSA|nr:hypothetical protein DUNSADRAFT_11769 [Dunaliella salina]|eukprot:KAF5832359.1 hypothetical protein DUNSADRAFT_11769 [Dunaliella salina]